MAMSFEDMFFPPKALKPLIDANDVEILELDEFIDFCGANPAQIKALLAPIHRTLAFGKACISGGFFRRMITGELPGGDIDVYFLGDNNKADRYREDVENRLEGLGFHLERESPAVHEFVHCSSRTGKPHHLPIQLVTFAAFSSPENVIDCNDFTNSMIAYDGKFVYFTKEALLDIQHRRLRPHRIVDMPRAFIRMEKFVREGWKITEADMKKMAASIRDFDTWFEKWKADTYKDDIPF